jgi:hypothetical protein
MKEVEAEVGRREDEGNENKLDRVDASENNNRSLWSLEAMDRMTRGIGVDLAWDVPENCLHLLTQITE